MRNSTLARAIDTRSVVLGRLKNKYNFSLFMAYTDLFLAIRLHLLYTSYFLA